MVFKDRKHLIPVFLIEGRCLKAERVEEHMLTPTSVRFLLCCLEELGPLPVACTMLPYLMRSIHCQAQLSPNAGEETSPWTSPRLTNYSRPPGRCGNAWI